MATSPFVRQSAGKRLTIPQNRIIASASEELIEEIRQLRASLSIYRHLVDRLLEKHALSRGGKRERNRQRPAA